MGRFASLKISSSFEAVIPSLTSMSLFLFSSQLSTASFAEALMFLGTCVSSSCPSTWAICSILVSTSDK